MNLKKKILSSGLSVSELVRTAWASAGSYRGTDMRGGANGARVRLAPQKDWTANNPEELKKVLAKFEEIQKGFNRGGKKVSIADLIVLGGAAALEEAARSAGYKNVKAPFTSGRADTTQELTDASTFEFLEPKADAFRNFYAEGNFFSPTESLVDRANLLGLTIPEMTVLIGGLRSLNANAAGSKHGVLTNKPGTLSNDFFVNLLDMSTKWQKSAKADGIYEGLDRKSGAVKWTATSVDLIFGSHSELRSIAEVYASLDGKQKFLTDFMNAWNKVMMLDRFDVKTKREMASVR